MTISLNVFCRTRGPITVLKKVQSSNVVCTNRTWSRAYHFTFHPPSSQFLTFVFHILFATMSFSTLASFALFGASVLAQQYAGDTIYGTLPQRSGSEIAYFKIRDPSGANDHLTLINYNSLGSDGNRLKPSNVQRAVIMMSGQKRDADQYVGYVSGLLDYSRICIVTNSLDGRS
jgi:hypothetical protein